MNLCFQASPAPQLLASHSLLMRAKYPKCIFHRSDPFFNASSSSSHSPTQRCHSYYSRAVRIGSEPESPIEFSRSCRSGQNAPELWLYNDYPTTWRPSRHYVFTNLHVDHGLGQSYTITATTQQFYFELAQFSISQRISLENLPSTSNSLSNDLPICLENMWR